MKQLRVMSMVAALAFLMAAGISCSDDSGFERKKYRNVPKAEYTREAPDEWAGTEDEHVPEVNIVPGQKEDIVIWVNMLNPGKDHYIEKIGLLDGKNKVLAVKEFNPNDKVFEAKFSSRCLPRDTSKVKVFAKCSLHDLWTVPYNK